MKTALINQLEAHGYQGRIVSIRRLRDLQVALTGIYNQGLLDEEFYRERLTGFVFKPPQVMPEARSIIIVAYKDPQIRFTFNWEGEEIPLVIPRTYLHWREKDKQVERILAQFLEPAGYRMAELTVPKKLLAVCSGLAVYGKNNITYVEGMGSFHRLAAFCSDLQCEQDEWSEPRMLERCERCQACMRNCPTGAINAERFLLRAERCITFWNEKPCQVAFPEWIRSAWHNCLVGCLHCQRICPENKGMLDWYQEGEEFSEEETNILRKGVPFADLPEALAEKLERWDLLDLLESIPRNLDVLLRSKTLPVSSNP